MRRITHSVLGAAVVMPLALAQEPLLASGLMIVGIAGGEAPDWIDFRSGFRRPVRIRHRGVSHGLPMLLLLSAGFALALWAIAGLGISVWGYDIGWSFPTIWPVTLGFGLGVLSHLLSDACTMSGVQPFLPFSRMRVWLLPRMFRSRSDGYLDKLVRLASVAVLGFGLILTVYRAVGASWR